MADFPLSLPCPQISGYAVNPTDQVIRTDFDAGNVRSRRRWITRNDKITVSWKFTAAQMADFRLWFDHADGANGGAAWFGIMLDSADGGLEAITARFAGIWQAAMLPGSLAWEVSATLETRPIPTVVDPWALYERLELPTLDLDFSTQSYRYFDGALTQTVVDPFASLITFSRPSTAEYYDADGVLQVAGINVPRIDHNPVTHECLGLRIQATDGVRAQDKAVLQSLMNWFRPDAGVIIMEYIENSPQQITITQAPAMLTNSNDGARQKIGFRRPVSSLSLVGAIYADGVVTGYSSLGTIQTGVTATCALKYKLGDTAGSLNGGIVSSSPSALAVGIDQFFIGSDSFYANGMVDAHIKRIRYFPFAMSNSRIQELTSA